MSFDRVIKLCVVSLFTLFHAANERIKRKSRDFLSLFIDSLFNFITFSVFGEKNSTQNKLKFLLLFKWNEFHERIQKSTVTSAVLVARVLYAFIATGKKVTQTHRMWCERSSAKSSDN